MQARKTCSQWRSRFAGSQAFTVIELQFLLGIIAVLIGLLLPAVQQLQEAASFLPAVQKSRAADELGTEVKALLDAVDARMQQTSEDASRLLLQTGGKISDLDVVGRFAPLEKEAAALIGVVETALDGKLSLSERSDLEGLLEKLKGLDKALALLAAAAPPDQQ